MSVTIDASELRVSGFQFKNLRTAERNALLESVRGKFNEIKDLWPKEKDYADLIITRWGPNLLSEESLLILGRAIKDMAVEVCGKRPRLKIITVQDKAPEVKILVELQTRELLK